VFDGPVATCPNAPATVKGFQPPVLPAWPVVNDLLTLPLAQRLELVQTLWDSIAAEQSGPDLTDADRQLIDQRLESFLVDGDIGLAADSVLAALEQSL
jgi:putative addiction module component (TIGR02574 family)